MKLLGITFPFSGQFEHREPLLQKNPLNQSHLSVTQAISRAHLFPSSLPLRVQFFMHNVSQLGLGNIAHNLKSRSISIYEKLLATACGVVSAASSCFSQGSLFEFLGGKLTDEPHHHTPTVCLDRPRSQQLDHQQTPLPLYQEVPFLPHALTEAEHNPAHLPISAFANQALTVENYSVKGTIKITNGRRIDTLTLDVSNAVNCSNRRRRKGAPIDLLKISDFVNQCLKRGGYSARGHITVTSGQDVQLFTLNLKPSELIKGLHFLSRQRIKESSDHLGSHLFLSERTSSFKSRQLMPATDLALSNCSFKKIPLNPPLFQRQIQWAPAPYRAQQAAVSLYHPIGSAAINRGPILKSDQLRPTLKDLQSIPEEHIYDPLSPLGDPPFEEPIEEIYEKPQPFYDEKTRIAMLSDCASIDGDWTAAHIDQFGIQDESMLSVIRKLCDCESNHFKKEVEELTKNDPLPDQEQSTPIKKFYVQVKKFTSTTKESSDAKPRAPEVGIAERIRESGLIKMAAECAEKDPYWTATHIQSFRIKSEEERIKILEICFEKKPTIIPLYIGNFDIQNPQKRFEFAQRCAEKHPVRVASNLGNFHIKDEEKRADLFISCAKQNPLKIGKYLPFFRIESQEKLLELEWYCVIESYARSAISEESLRSLNDIKMAEECAYLHGEWTEQHLEEFGIEDQQMLIWIKKLCEIGKTRLNKEIEDVKESSSLPDQKQIDYKTFLIQEEKIREKRLILMARICAEKNPFWTAAHAQLFPIKDEEKQFELALSLSKQEPIQTARYLSHFGIKNEEMLADLFRGCAIHNPLAALEYLPLSGIKSEQKLLELQLYCSIESYARSAISGESLNSLNNIRMAQQCAYLDGEWTEQHLEEFGIEDQQMLIWIKKLCEMSKTQLNQEVKNKVTDIYLLRNQPNSSQFKELCVQTKKTIKEERLALIAKHCVERNASWTAAHIKSFYGISEELTVTIARIYANQYPIVLPLFIQQLSIADQQELLELAKLCALENQKATLPYIENFRINDPEAVFELVMSCAKKDPVETANNIHHFRIKDQELLSQIFLYCVKKNASKVYQSLILFDIESKDHFFELECYSFIQMYSQLRPSENDLNTLNKCVACYLRAHPSLPQPLKIFLDKKFDSSAQQAQSFLSCLFQLRYFFHTNKEMKEEEKQMIQYICTYPDIGKAIKLSDLFYDVLLDDHALNRYQEIWTSAPGFKQDKCNSLPHLTLPLLGMIKWAGPSKDLNVIRNFVRTYKEDFQSFSSATLQQWVSTTLAVEESCLDMNRKTGIFREACSLLGQGKQEDFRSRFGSSISQLSFSPVPTHPAQQIKEEEPLFIDNFEMKNPQVLIDLSAKCSAQNSEIPILTMENLLLQVNSQEMLTARLMTYAKQDPFETYARLPLFEIEPKQLKKVECVCLIHMYSKPGISKADLEELNKGKSLPFLNSHPSIVNQSLPLIMRQTDQSLDVDGQARSILACLSQLLYFLEMGQQIGEEEVSVLKEKIFQCPNLSVAIEISTLFHNVLRNETARKLYQTTYARMQKSRRNQKGDFSHCILLLLAPIKWGVDKKKMGTIYSLVKKHQDSLLDYSSRYLQQWVVDILNIERSHLLYKDKLKLFKTSCPLVGQDEKKGSIKSLIELGKSAMQQVTSSMRQSSFSLSKRSSSTHLSIDESMNGSLDQSRLSTSQLSLFSTSSSRSPTGQINDSVGPLIDLNNRLGIIDRLCFLNQEVWLKHSFSKQMTDELKKRLVLATPSGLD